MTLVKPKSTQTKLVLNGKVFNLTTEEMSIISKYFNVDKDGNLECNNAKMQDAEFNGGNIRLYQPNESSLALLGIYSDKTSNPERRLLLWNDGLDIYNYETLLIRLRIGYYLNGSVAGPSLSLYSKDGSKETRVDTEQIHLFDGTNDTYIRSHEIVTPTLYQTSQEKNKKNFEKLDIDTALKIILDTDIYKYNLKNQTDGDKKHIGFVIGDKYKYSEEITSENNDGVDNYSMTSASYGAIQKLYSIIQDLQAEIKELKGEQ